ncbi:Cytochrome c oxidase subunit 7A2, mitochondrial [Collichthys lucidus]|uniref:Cytochrome c oxidase subunit 7A2, mitochondrial n=1 Tax=Collichthys lucidus TaxID=240159 RepID=A0A4U5UKW5_COLLU|nr:Cytochrome c oxidase subunit 7A2, mitochondrial [Collichthys lucidus]
MFQSELTKTSSGSKQLLDDRAEISFMFPRSLGSFWNAVHFPKKTAHTGLLLLLLEDSPNRFQTEDNGMPIHLKGGSSDAVLYRTTMALTVLGTGYALYELVKASFPQQK